MKDETQMKPIIEFVCSAPKCYSFNCDDHNVKKSKGVTKACLKKEIKHEDYKNTIMTGERLVRSNTTIRSFKHQVFTYRFTKYCLSAYDDKIYRFDNNSGCAYGHYQINN